MQNTTQKTTERNIFRSIGERPGASRTLVDKQLLGVLRTDRSHTEAGGERNRLGKQHVRSGWENKRSRTQEAPEKQRGSVFDRLKATQPNSTLRDSIEPFSASSASIGEGSPTAVEDNSGQGPKQRSRGPPKIPLKGPGRTTAVELDSQRDSSIVGSIAFSSTRPGPTSCSPAPAKQKASGKPKAGVSLQERTPTPPRDHREVYPVPSNVERFLRKFRSILPAKNILSSSSPDHVTRSTMRTYFQFVTTPTADTPGTTLVLHFQDRRYLFGHVAEGTQRAFIQQGVKSVKVQDIFLTGKTEWATTGGLIGMILTMADHRDSMMKALADQARQIAIKAEQKARARGDNQAADAIIKEAEKAANESGLTSSFTLHGDANLAHSLASARKFVFRRGMPLDINDWDDAGQRDLEKPAWSDSNIRVWPMPIHPKKIENSIPPPTSPRKRSYDDFHESSSSIRKSSDVSMSDGTDPSTLRSDAETTGRVSPRTSPKEDQEARKNIVKEMFNSAWRMDALIEVPLKDVKMPASIFIRRPENGNRIAPYIGPKPGDDEPLPDITVMVRRPWPGALVQKLPPAKPSTVALSYIIRDYPQRGKFLPQKALELGVKNKPLWGKLSNMENVTLDDGRVITPEMVLEPTKPGSGMAIVDLPSEDYVEDLIKRPEWSLGSVMDCVGTIVWILGSGVAAVPALQKFMEERKHINHIISSTDICPNHLAMDSAAAATMRLNQVDPRRYPVPVHDNLALPQKGFRNSRPVNLSASVIPAQRGLKIQLEPTHEVLRDEIVPTLDTAQVLAQTPPSVLRIAKQARDELEKPDVKRDYRDVQKDMPSKDAEIITLGTGSQSPSKYRNVSGIALKVPGHGNYILDCGENTLGQLKRVFTAEEYKDFFDNLKMIWISHLHADHHLGLVSLIRAWYDHVYGGSDPTTSNPSSDIRASLAAYPASALLQDKRLVVASEGDMMNFLADYSSMEDFGYDKIVPLRVEGSYQPTAHNTRMSWNDTRLGFDTKDPALNQAMKIVTGLESLQTTFVPHCRNSQGVALTFSNGFKVTYSGDCRPCSGLVKIGKGSTVLIHEATFDDELQGDAKAKKHSTTSEALGVGLSMGARRILLTHFSQRYQKIPVMSNIGELQYELEDNTAAQDADANVPVVEETAADSTEAAPQPEKRAPSPSQHLLSRTRTSPKNIGDVKVGVAFDYMRVKVGEIAHLERFTPALLKLYEVGRVDEELGRLRQQDDDEDDSSNNGKTKNSNKNKKKNKYNNNSKTGGKAGSGGGGGSQNDQQASSSKADKQVKKDAKRRQKMVEHSHRKEEEVAKRAEAQKMDVDRK